MSQTAPIKPELNAPTGVSWVHNQHSASLVGLACVLALSCVLFLERLGTPYITLYDEAVHVNVVRNLAESCCIPQLHTSRDVETDYRKWSNNRLWLHKPLLTFYLAAGSYKLLGGSLFALRLPGAIFALLTVVVIYLTGRKFFGDVVGLCGAAIFGLNPYTNSLVHGRAFAGFPDLGLVFFTSLSLYLILEWTQNKSDRTLLWLGAAIGLGYMCKGGLALAPFVVLAEVAILTRTIREVMPGFLKSILVFVALALPERIYWLSHHPVEFRYEEHLQIAHLFKVIGPYGAPWHAYVARYLPDMLTMLVVPLAYFSIVWALVRCRPGQPEHTLSLWTLTYLVPLSIGVSKIENFIFAVLPAIALLVPQVVSSLIRQGKNELLVSLCLSSGGAFILSRETNLGAGWIILVASTILAGTLAILSMIKFKSKAVTTVTVALTLVAVFSVYVHRDASANKAEPEDSVAQNVLRQTGLDLRHLVDRNSLVLVHSSLAYPYLYLMYWSGVDVFDVCRSLTNFAPLQGHRESLYLITQAALPYRMVQKLPLGTLYSLNELSFGAWSPVVIGECQLNQQGR